MNMIKKIFERVLDINKINRVINKNQKYYMNFNGIQDSKVYYYIISINLQYLKRNLVDK
jgi:hypothetical protein